MRAALAEKDLLNPEEAVTLFNLSRRKLARFLNEPDLPFVLLYNKRKLIDRKLFEKYLSPELKESLKKGEAPACARRYQHEK